MEFGYLVNTQWATYMEEIKLGDQSPLPSSLPTTLPTTWAVLLLVAGIVVSQIYLGATVQSIGIPGIFMICFGHNSSNNNPEDYSNIALQAHNGQYVSAENGGGDVVVANRNEIRTWETFKVKDLGNGNIVLQAYNGQYVCAENGGGSIVVANRSSYGAWETFKLLDLGKGDIALQAHNGQYVSAKNGGGDVIVANGNVVESWETFRLIPR